MRIEARSASGCASGRSARNSAFLKNDFMAIPADQQSPQVPPPNMLGGIAAQGFTGGLLKTDQMGHDQPAKDQKVTIAEPGPQRLKKLLYFFGQTR